MKEFNLITVKSISERKFNLGDIVRFNESIGEIVNIHPKYATVVSEGAEHRVWTKDLTLSDSKPKRNQLFKESFIYKGYQTKHFNRYLAEEFKELSKESDDEYAVLECIKCLDYAISIDDKLISENFNSVRIQCERLRRYSKKIGATYLSEKILQVIDEELLKYSLLEGVRYTTVDKNVIARVVASVADVSNNGIDPVTIVNQAANKIRTSQLTNQGWQLIGRLFNTATLSGINWNKDIFSNSIKTLMELK
jgi:hypothetical protein